MQIFFFTLLFSIPLGLIVMFLRRSKLRIPLFPFIKNGKIKFIRLPVISLITKFIISVLRGTPLMLQLIVVFFGPYFVFGIKLGNIWNWNTLAAITAFSINYAAYFAEIYRGGLESIPKGQNEAASVLGFSRARTFFHIILPQMTKNVLPAVTNETITLVKDTSLAFTISYIEMFTVARQISNREVSILPLFAAGVFYYVTNLLVAFIMEFVEKKMNYYKN
ncbi:MAG: amino acid ABC transporter permease [Oscillospiraceae bacterium]|nr:amino acid ABC transporter permease [Oscillospiraceae bacterium]